MEMLNNIKIGTRLAMGFTLAILALILVIVISLINFSKINSSINDIASDKFPKTVWANNIASNVNENARVIRNLMLVTDPQQLITERKRIDLNIKEDNAYIDSLTGRMDTEKGKDIINRITVIKKNEYEPKLNIMLDLVNQGNRDAAVKYLVTEFRGTQNRYFALIDELIKYQSEMVNTSAKDASDMTTSIIILMVILGSVITIALVIFSILLIRSIIRPCMAVKGRILQLQEVCITNLDNSLLAMSDGNLSVKVESGIELLNYSYKDEIGEMSNTVDKMITQIETAISAYEKVRTRIKDLVNEINELIKNAKEGLLDNRGNASKFNGAYKDLVDGFNGVLDAVILPIQDGARILEVMGTGDLTVRSTKEYRGQHQKIIDSINTLGDSLGSVVADVSEAVEATASATTQISSSTEEMAAGVQEQSSQAAEVATAVEQMTKTILQTTSNASNTADVAKNAGKVAKEGGIVVRNTIDGMNRIAFVVTKAAQTVQELGKSSDQIGEIIQVIDDIADQTNLLALNAAIEAARAGEQGRGFAVVADEVRKLAERTTKATKEIAGMIKRIQHETKGAVESMEEGSAEVENGKGLAVQAGESLDQIISGSEEVVDRAMQVAAASEQQSSAAEEISKNIEAISNVTNESATGTQQIAKAAEDLNRLTERLLGLVAKFKVNNQGNTNSKREFYSKLSVRENGKILHQ
jgi:methyl-accepting chemotaxis protein